MFLKNFYSILFTCWSLVSLCFYDQLISPLNISFIFIVLFVRPLIEKLLILLLLSSSSSSSLRAVTCRRFESGTCRSACRSPSYRNINTALPAWRFLQTGSTSSAWATSTTWWSTCGTGRYVSAAEYIYLSIPVFMITRPLTLSGVWLTAVNFPCLSSQQQKHVKGDI